MTGVQTCALPILSIGAIKLAGFCADIESMIRLQNRDGLAGRVEAMDRETAVVLQALRHLIDGTSP